MRFTKHPPVERHTWIEAPFNENRAVWQHLMGDEVWTGDDEEDELPILGSEESTPKPKRRRRNTPVPRGNVPTAMAGEARRAVLAEATGSGAKEEDQWRTELGMGQRDRAAATLSSSGRRSGGGFGLA